MSKIRLTLASVLSLFLKTKPLAGEPIAAVPHSRWMCWPGRADTPPRVANWNAEASPLMPAERDAARRYRPQLAGWCVPGIDSLRYITREYPCYWALHMMTSSNGNIFPRYWSFVRGIHRSPVDSPHKGQSRVALIFSFMCAGKYGWANSRNAGDLRRH